MLGLLLSGLYLSVPFRPVNKIISCACSHVCIIAYTFLGIPYYIHLARPRPAPVIS
jgi:Na+/proline symporter